MKAPPIGVVLPGLQSRQFALQLTLVVMSLLLFAGAAAAHAVAEGDKGYIREISGMHLIPFIYLGAKHMVTGDYSDIKRIM
jgi:hypothetical protein